MTETFVRMENLLILLKEALRRMEETWLRTEERYFRTEMTLPRMKPGRFLTTKNFP